MELKKWELHSTQLKAQFDPKLLPFETTAELAPAEGIIGQERAVRAMDFGLHMDNRGYNIFVSGIPGTGKSSIIKPMIKQVAEALPTPPDWCYVHNFQSPDHPKAISLPAGKGKIFQRDMLKLIESLKESLTKVFQAPEYQDQRRKIEESFNQERDRLSDQLNSRAKNEGFMIESSPLGIILIPLLNGKPIIAEELEKLDPKAREELQRKEQDLHEHIHLFVQTVRKIREDMEREIESLNFKVARYSTEHLFELLRGKYNSISTIQEYIQAVQQNVLEKFKDFLPSPEPPMNQPGGDFRDSQNAMLRYSVNVIVDHGPMKGAPLIEETNPTYNNLVGQIEKKSQFGTFYSDFTLIKGGSLLQANGGFLIVNALDLLKQPFSWDAIKRTSKNGEIKIEDVGDLYGFITTSGIKPEPIPVNIRFILVGSPSLYYLLHSYDEDFSKIFKVKADFDIQQSRNEETPLQYSRFIAKFCKEEGLLHFDRNAVAAVLEESSRWTSHQNKLSLEFSSLVDLLRESDYWARKENKEVVSLPFVLKAVQEKIYRSNLIEDYIGEMIAEGSIMVDVEGEVVGQVNGLSVYDLGDFSFGRPSRITARTFIGGGGIINIDREAKLSGKTHSKGVLILSGYLGGRYAGEFPLSLSATLAFEQSYGEVDGDSASTAELVALLSSLANIPIQQGIALTGSVNQRGEAQAIGGVNEKIEGFFATCKSLGMSGKQGVIIPKQNVRNLILRDDVISAVERGEFHIYAVSHVDEVLEILTGMPAGEIQPDGSYPSGSINERIIHRLKEMDDKMGERTLPENELLSREEGE
ncbi:MAG: AAA family ATPase [Nitrospiria bacterium]